MRSASTVLIACLLLVGCSESGSKNSGKQAAAPQPPHIINFYATPPVVARGESVSLCYGIENAVSVRIEPDVDGTGPSPNRCVQATPARDTEYTLVAESATGEKTTKTVPVKVSGRASAGSASSRGPHLIRAFAATATRVAPGQMVTLCYEVEGTASVQLEPERKPLDGPKGCLSVSPAATTTYGLLATGTNGKRERADVTITVR